LILSIFLLVIGLALALLITGVVMSDYAIQLVGFSFLFISGTILLAGNVEYKTGLNSSEYYVYGDNYSGYHWDYMNEPPTCPPNNLDCVKLFHVEYNEFYNYGSFSDSTSHWLGVYLMIISIIGSAVIFTRLKAESDDDL